MSITQTRIDNVMAKLQLSKEIRSSAINEMKRATKPDWREIDYNQGWIDAIDMVGRLMKGEMKE
jgi:hypothetical protein